MKLRSSKEMSDGRSSGRTSETLLLSSLISWLCTLALECLLPTILSMFLGHFMSEGVFGVRNCSKVVEPASGYEVQISLYVHVEERGRDGGGGS